MIGSRSVWYKWSNSYVRVKSDYHISMLVTLFFQRNNDNLQVGCFCSNEPSHFTDVCVVQSYVDVIQYEDGMVSSHGTTHMSTYPRRHYQLQRLCLNDNHYTFEPIVRHINSTITEFPRNLLDLLDGGLNTDKQFRIQKSSHEARHNLLLVSSQ